MTLIFDYGTPYNIFTGVWTCTAATYTPKGDFVGCAASNVAIYWSEPNKRLHFRQTDEVNVHQLATTLALSPAVTKFVAFEFDLEIKGKCATGGAPGLVNVGAETTPDCYIFHITAGDYAWWNNQYCGTANERRVIGPSLFKNEVQTVISQHLLRISYEVPDKFRRELRPL